MLKLNRRAADYIPVKFGAMIYPDGRVGWELGKDGRYHWGCTCDHRDCKHVRRIRKLLWLQKIKYSKKR